MTGKATAIGGGLLGAAALAYASLFTVPENGQALVLQLGKVERVVQQAGLHAKLPFVQDVVEYEKRTQEFLAPPEEVIAADQKRFVVDSFATYRIVDPLRFYQTVGTDAVARTRLSAMISGSLRRVLGGETLAGVLSAERTAIMRRIAQEVDGQARGLGLEVLDVRIMRADLPDANSQAVFARMQSEREREAREFRAQGAEAAQRIRSAADRDRTVLLAEAKRQAQVLRGQGESEAARIYAEAHGRNEEFFRFSAALDAYRHAFRTDTTVVLSPEGEFFRYFSDPGTPQPLPRAVTAGTPAEAPAPPAAPAAGKRPPVVAAAAALSSE